MKSDKFLLIILKGVPDKSVSRMKFVLNKFSTWNQKFELEN